MTPKALDPERGIPLWLSPLDAFLAWEDDFGRQTSCCIVGGLDDGEEPDCESCEFRTYAAKLSPDDLSALHAYAWLSRPVVIDLKLGSTVGAMLGLRMTKHDARDLLERLDLIHRYRKSMAPPAGPESSEP